MKLLNLVIILIFSSAGGLSAMENIDEGVFSTWPEVFSIFPTALISGGALLALSLMSSPFSSWRPIALNRFLLNPSQPHSLIFCVSTIFFVGGLIGIFISDIFLGEVSKIPVILLMSGFGGIIPTLSIHSFLYFRPNV